MVEDVVVCVVGDCTFWVCVLLSMAHFGTLRWIFESCLHILER